MASSPMPGTNEIKLQTYEKNYFISFSDDHHPDELRAGDQH